ncbi:hypothetical protein NDU88_004869, partial [Pleurodeles waltl]
VPGTPRAGGLLGDRRRPRPQSQRGSWCPEIRCLYSSDLGWIMWGLVLVQVLFLILFLVLVLVPVLF